MNLRRAKKGHLRGSIFLSTLVMAGLLGIPEAHSGVQAGANLFDKGKTRISFVGSSGRAFDQNYLILGLGAGYFVVKGMELGLDFDAWLGNDPTIYQLTPQIRYVLDLGRPLHPYIGAFYSRTFYEDFEDLDSLGFRVGVFSRLGARTYIGIGLVYDKLLDCDEKIYQSCTEIYPEAVLSVSF